METPKEPAYCSETSLIRPDNSSFHFQSGTIDLAHRTNVPNLNVTESRKRGRRHYVKRAISPSVAHSDVAAEYQDDQEVTMA